MTTPTGDPQQQLVRRILAIEAMAKEALRRPATIPVRDEDPPDDDPTNVWLFPDGRMRMRHRAPDGVAWTIREFEPVVVPGGDTSTVPTPDPPAQPTVHQQTFAATWWATYRQDGVKRLDVGDQVHQGRLDAYSGRQRGLIGFDQPAIAALLAGATVNDGWLQFTNLSAFYDSVTYAIGLHDEAAEPATWSTSTVEVARGDWPKTGPRATSLRLGIGIGQGLRDGTAAGVGFEAPSDSLEFAGSLDGASVQLVLNWTM